ncbi:hypothetical protein Gotur_030853 [Gossypium turneri]
MLSIVLRLFSSTKGHNQGQERVSSKPVKSMSVALSTTSDFALSVVSTSKDFKKKKRQMGMASDLEDSYSSSSNH